MTRVELRTTAMAVGGEAVAREPSGRVAFISGALAHETVLAELTTEKRSFARGVTIEVRAPSPDRVTPPCPHVAEGCGGCDWQHIAVPAQTRLRVELVREVLTRQASFADPDVQAGPAVAVEGVRTTVRGMADAQGRFAFRRRRSHELVAADGCGVAHPLVRDLIDQCRFTPGASVTLRVGARTGDRMVVVGPSAAGASAPPDAIVVGQDELAARRRAWIHEEAAGRRWRVSAGSFFQASPEGAEALVAAAREHAGTDGSRMVDLCCGVGLFAGALGDGRSVVGVERSAAAVADARANLKDRDVRLVKVALARWRPSPADVVVADPARSGLGAAGVAAVAATGAQRCVLVSCDPGALGRDAALLRDGGYDHVGSTVIDLFGHTSHIEVVSGFSFVGEVGRGGS